MTVVRASQAVTTVTFTGSGRRTTLTILVQYRTRQDRDAHATYMDDGLADALRLLEQTAMSLLNGPGGS
jgi:uncharacterized protein YndB with AHSA1/START domain